MKTTVLSELPVRPERYEKAHCDRVDYSTIFSQMSPIERRFINGLLRYYQPKRVLEIGVSRGGGTVNILNALEDMPDTSLCSIDIIASDHCGIEAKTLFPDIPTSRWQLIEGCDTSKVVAKLAADGKFDFVVIDSMHLHPVESLNFLSILPFLNEGTIVVLHDISVFVFPKENGTNLAARILYSSVVAEKLSPYYGDEIHENSLQGITNIAAFQISTDTLKYIGNVFDGLYLPWEHYPFQYLDTVRALIALHYSAENLEKFNEARGQNGAWLFSGKKTYSAEKLRVLYAEKFAIPTIFYGAGYHMRIFLGWLHELGIHFKAKIWDIAAETIGEINGVEIKSPDFKTKVTSSVAVITIEDAGIAASVRTKLESLGYKVYHGVGEYLNGSPQ